MFEGKFEGLKKSLIKKDENGNKKSIENLLVFAILLVITIIAINYIWKGNNKNKKNIINSNKTLAQDNIINQSDNTSNELEEKLKNILSSINGVGDVNVLITYSQTSKINPLYNEDSQQSVTQEEDNTGGKRTVSTNNNKKEAVYSNNNLITQSITSPEIQGAVVIAKGAGNVNVKTNIIQAVEAATGLATYKIQVFEMK